jgi:hypothetical protein
MNLIELNRSLVQLRLSGMAAVLETRLLRRSAACLTVLSAWAWLPLFWRLRISPR